MMKSLTIVSTFLVAMAVTAGPDNVLSDGDILTALLENQRGGPLNWAKPLNIQTFHSGHGMEGPGR